MNDPHSVLVSNGYSIVDCYATRTDAGPSFSLTIAPYCTSCNRINKCNTGNFSLCPVYLNSNTQYSQTGATFNYTYYTIPDLNFDYNPNYPLTPNAVTITPQEPLDTCVTSINLYFKGDYNNYHFLTSVGDTYTINTDSGQTTRTFRSTC